MKGLIVIVGILALAALCSGCAGQTGWSFSVGVTPINSVSDTKALNVSKAGYESDWKEKGDK